MDSRTVAELTHRPWLLPLAVATVFAAAYIIAAVQAGVHRQRHARLVRGARIIEIACPPEVDEHSAAVLWSHLLGLLRPTWKRALFGQPHLCFEYVATAHGLGIRLWVPGAISIGLVGRAIRSAWPGATITDKPARPPLPVGCVSTGGQLLPGHGDCFPLKSEHARDPIRTLCESVTGLRSGEYAVVQVLARPVTGRRLNRPYRTAAALRGARSATIRGEILDLLTPTAAPISQTSRPAELARSHPQNAEQVKAILAKAGQPRYAIAIRYAIGSTRPASNAGQLRGRAHALASVFALYTSGHQFLRRHRLRHPARTLAERRLGRGFLASLAELAALAHLPYDADAPGVARAAARPVAPVPAVLSRPFRARVLGDADAGQPRPVALGIAEARQHVHVIGETGVGKSTLLANLILADAAAGRGAVVIDPKGDLVTDVLARLPEAAVDNCVIFDPADAPPPAINVLAGPDPVFAVDAIVTIFHRCFTSAWGPRVDDLLRSACLTLTRVLGTRTGLSDVPRLLTDSAYRARITARLDDELLTGFWDAYNALTPAGRSAVIGPVMNKLRAVLLRPFVASAIASPHTSIDLRRHLDGGGLVLARLPKGVLGDDATRLFGSLLVAHTWQAITRRAGTTEATRPDTGIYVDECHNFLNLPGSLPDILAEARGYRLSLILAHQHLAQLPKDLREALSADARNKIYFTTSPEDANGLRHHVTPHLTAGDLSHLDSFQAAARLITTTGPAPACTFRTRPLPPPTPERERQVRDASRARFAADSSRQAKRGTKAAKPDPRLRFGDGVPMREDAG